MPKVKVTVIDKKCYPDLQEKYLAYPDAGPCNVFEVGQEFIFDGHAYQHMNNGNFCMEAWDAINRYAYAALQGGSIMKGWTKACCNDGTRPVIFKIERIDE